MKRGTANTLMHYSLEDEIPGDDMQELIAKHCLLCLFWILVSRDQLHTVSDAVQVASVRH